MMKLNSNQRLVTFIRAERLNNSIDGNPRFRIISEYQNGSVKEFITKSDASCNYDVENAVRDGKPRVITLTRAGRIERIQTLDEI